MVSEERVFEKIIFYNQSLLDLISNKYESIYEKKTTFPWMVEMNAIAWEVKGRGRGCRAVLFFLTSSVKQEC